jgi:outer membrane receptor for Fe3+-dicitrate
MDAVGTGGNLDRKFIKLHIDLLKNGSIISSEDFRRDTKRGLEVGACYTFERLLKSFANFAIKWTANQISIAENPGAREESAENKVEQDD